MEQDNIILKIRALSMDFPLRSNRIGGKPQVLHALTGVTLDVYEGETLGIIGESGCGKSTLGKCIMRLHQPTAGSIEFQGQDLLKLPRRQMKQVRRNLQMVFQDPFSSLDPRKEAGRIIEEPLIIHKVEPNPEKRQEMVLNLMHEVGLDIQHTHRFPHEFSGGQRQRINVARALALNPKIIVCDEPVSALDVSVQAQVLNLLKELQDTYGLTYLFISHDLGVIKHISNRVAIMYLGHIVELCDADEIYHNPLHPYTQALLSAIPPSSPFEKKKEVPLKGEISSPIGEQRGCPLAPRCPHCTQVCQEQLPVLREVSRRHSVACLRYGTQGL
ncbi:oligopeptide/dipeptide ABC transporter ATP-binding protein [Oscillospiraceae bacterium 50-16]